jgi:hypothetical protein
MRIDASLACDVEPLFMRVAIVLQPSSYFFVANISSSIQRFDSLGDASANSTSGSVADCSRPQRCHCHRAPPTSFLGTTFGIANNDNTKEERAKEEREGVGDDGDQAQHMTRHKKLPDGPYFMTILSELQEK